MESLDGAKLKCKLNTMWWVILVGDFKSREFSKRLIRNV